MKTKALFVALLLLGSVLKAEILQFGIWGGYTTVQMATVNETLDKVRDQIKSDTSGAISPDLTYLHDAYVVGFDANYLLTPNLAIGPRVEILSAVPAKIHALAVSGGSTATLNGTYEAQLIPVMAGITEKHAWTDRLSLDTSAYAGVGFAKVHQIQELKVDGTVPGLTPGHWESYMGGTCVMGEVSASLKFKISILTAGLTLGWRVADVPEFNFTDDFQMMGSETHKKGEAVKDPSERVMDLDYGGGIVGISTSIAF